MSMQNASSGHINQQMGHRLVEQSKENQQNILSLVNSTACVMQVIKGVLAKDLIPVNVSPPTSLGKGDWVELEYVQYTDDQNVERKWERCVRKQCRRRSGSEAAVNAVDIHAILKPREGQPQMLLVVQYRPAIERYCIEFPSGLMDANDNDPLDCAQRELREETGYEVPKEQFELVRIPVAYEPGLTNSCCYVATIIIEADGQSTTSPQLQSLEPDEWSLQTITVPVKNMLDCLIDLQQSQNGLLIIDSRLHAYASGLKSSERFWQKADDH